MAAKVKSSLWVFYFPRDQHNRDSPAVSSSSSLNLKAAIGLVKDGFV